MNGEIKRPTKIWFHCLRGIFHVSTFLTTQNFSIKPKTQLLKKGKKHWHCCGECLLPTTFSAGCKGWRLAARECCCSFVPHLHRRFHPCRQLPSQHRVVQGSQGDSVLQFHNSGKGQPAKVAGWHSPDKANIEKRLTLCLSSLNEKWNIQNSRASGSRKTAEYVFLPLSKCIRKIWMYQS